MVQATAATGAGGESSCKRNWWGSPTMLIREREPPQNIEKRKLASSRA
jgi:hypothetical protein